jgi:small subunit ribosomal protein S1
LDGIDGLIHISELSWSHVNHPSEVLTIGQKVEVRVLDIDRDRQRISLGLKQTQKDPWQQVFENRQVNEIVHGVVTKLVSFGAFVEIEEGVEGLIHISELAQHHVEDPAEIVRPGQEVNVKIIEIDPERRRLSLSLKRLEPEYRIHEDAMAEEGEGADAVGEEVEAAVAPAAEAAVAEKVAEVTEAEVAEAEVAEAEAASEPKPAKKRASKTETAPEAEAVAQAGGEGEAETAVEAAPETEEAKPKAAAKKRTAKKTETAEEPVAEAKAETEGGLGVSMAEEFVRQRKKSRGPDAETEAEAGAKD